MSRIPGFFYGLFMDPEVLAAHGIPAREGVRAFAEGFGLRIGARATLVPAPGERACGMVYSLTEEEFERLYAGPGLVAYRSEQLLVHTPDGTELQTRCYNLPEAPHPDEANPDYAAKLRATLARLDFPADCVDAAQ